MSFLPLFPLQMIAYPGEVIRLHIFEPRYRQLIGECRDTGSTFGIPPYFQGRLVEYGTEMRLLEIFKTHEGGEMDIAVEGVRAFHLDNFLAEAPHKLYAGGNITPIENDPAVDPGVPDALHALYSKLHEILKTGHARANFHVENLSFRIAPEVGLRLAQRIELLAIPAEADRQRLLLEHLQHLVPVLEAVEETRTRIGGNGKFHKLPKLEF
jgi:Lon protease-like protein